MKWLRDLGAILKVGGGALFAAGLGLLIMDIFIALPVFLSSNVFSLIMFGVMMMMVGYGIGAIFGE